MNRFSTKLSRSPGNTPSSNTVAVGLAGGAVFADRCMLATTPWRRLVGLLGRRTLEPGAGVLLRKTGSIHMFFMRFAIDAVFLDRDDHVVKIVPQLKPWRLAAARGAKSVLEVAPGTCEAHGIGVGDQIVTSPHPADGTSDA